jgi:hypothetical protein
MDSFMLLKLKFCIPSALKSGKTCSLSNQLLPALSGLLSACWPSYHLPNDDMLLTFVLYEWYSLSSYGLVLIQRFSVLRGQVSKFVQ